MTFTSLLQTAGAGCLSELRRRLHMCVSGCILCISQRSGFVVAAFTGALLFDADQDGTAEHVAAQHNAVVQRGTAPHMFCTAQHNASTPLAIISGCLGTAVPAHHESWCSPPWSCLFLLRLLQVLQPILSDPDREPALRLALLQLLYSLIEGPSTAGVFVASSSNAVLAELTGRLGEGMWTIQQCSAAWMQHGRGTADSRGFLLTLHPCKHRACRTLAAA